MNKDVKSSQGFIQKEKPGEGGFKWGFLFEGITFLRLAFKMRI